METGEHAYTQPTRALAFRDKPASLEWLTLMKRRIPTTAPASHAVRFEFTAPEARQVLTAGSFNEWRSTAFPMIGLGDSKWAKDRTPSTGGYEYVLVVDDARVPDPAAAETVPNTFAGLDAVVGVPRRGK